MARLKLGRSIVFPFSGILYSLYGYRVDRSSEEKACVVLAPEQPHQKSAININDFHCAAEHSQVLLCKTAQQQGIVLEGELLECRGCSTAKGLPKSIKQSTYTRVETKLGTVFCGFEWT